jgi:fructose-1,6-bisphosphatase/inositol monophosphatase family enzyme
MANVRTLLEPIRRLHDGIRKAVLRACQQAESDSLTRVAREGEGDTIYAVDRVSEDFLVEFFEREVAFNFPLVLIAEGLPQGQLVLPRCNPESEAVWRVLVDPIDGTRELMYQKRSAWILTGVAPNRGPETNLQDIELAVQTEIPLVKQHLADCIWAVRGQGVRA